MIHEGVTLPAFETLALDDRLLRDLRSDHAGETGAVYIYRGMLALARDTDLVAFAKSHLATERAHLATLDGWLPSRCRSRLLPLWRVAGWSLGFLAVAFGRRAAFATIRTVEEFVVAHYAAQIVAAQGPLRALLVRLQGDEAAHRDDASARVGPGPLPLPLRAWLAIVKHGSAAAVSAARWI